MQRPLFALCLMAALFFGCVNIDYTQKVARDGTSIVTEKVNLTAFMKIEGMSEDDMHAQLDSECANLSAGDMGLTCSYEGGVLIVSKAMGPSDGFYSFNKTSEFPYALYTLEVSRLPPIVDTNRVTLPVGQGERLDSDLSEPSSALAAKTLRTAGAKITYEVEMPGQLLSAEGGEIRVSESGARTAIFDVTSMMSEGRHMVVTSREPDTALILMAMFGAATIIGGIAVGAVLLKAMKK